MKTSKKTLVIGALVLSAGMLSVSHSQANALRASGATADIYSSYQGPVLAASQVDPSPMFWKKIGTWVLHRLIQNVKPNSADKAEAMASSDAVFDVAQARSLAR